MENNLHISNIFPNFGAWIGGSCKPSDKGKLTAFPRFINCQQKLNNVSNMLTFEQLPEINSPRWLSLEDLDGEIWKDVVGFEDVLQISCYGRFKRKKRYSYNKHSGNCLYSEKIIKLHSQNNYQHVCISIGKNTKHNFSIHRVVAEAFIPNPDNLPYINHKDENPKNNCVDNLEWCTPKYNSNYGTIKEKIKCSRLEHGKTHQVALYEYDGTFVKMYLTAEDAAKEYNISGELVIQCCKGNIPSAHGLHFRFLDDTYKKRKMTRMKNEYTIVKDGKILFSSMDTKETAKFLNVDYGSFRGIVKYKTKYCEALKDYEIQIYTQEGEFYKIINGKKEKGRLWI